MVKCTKCELENIEEILDLLGEGKLYQCNECMKVFVK